MFGCFFSIDRNPYFCLLGPLRAQGPTLGKIIAQEIHNQKNCSGMLGPTPNPRVSAMHYRSMTKTTALVCWPKGL